MSEDAEQEQRTEAPSGRRLGEARAEGKLPMGHDAVIVAGTAGAAIALAMVGGAFATTVRELLAFSTANVDRMPFRDLSGLALRPALLVLVVPLAAGLAATVTVITQTGGGFWPHLAGPDLSRVFSPGRLTRMFQKDFAFDLLLNIGKVAAVVAAAWSPLSEDIRKIPTLLGTPIDAQLAFGFGMLVHAGKPILAAALLLAAAELFLARWRFMKQMKMTKQEAKDEAKADEGDPSMKGKRKRKHREFLKGIARVEVPRADALVVNPTHIAIAIRYRKEEGRAPRVTAKGKGQLAEYMRELARENGIPIYQDIPLARLLYRKVKVGREVPAQTYKAVATVLAFVYRVAGRRPGAAPGARA